MVKRGRDAPPGLVNGVRDAPPGWVQGAHDAPPGSVGRGVGLRSRWSKHDLLRQPTGSEQALVRQPTGAKELVGQEGTEMLKPPLL